MKPDTPHIAFPFKLSASGKNLLYREQDTEDEVIDCVEVLVRTPVGSRLELPGYGVREQEFSMGGAVKEEIVSACAIWEPRAAVTLEREPELLDGLVDNLRLNIQGRTD